ncbi:hypothetical protein [Rhizobium sp. CCGE531]|uniref:hypothetical protein n=1 Tax=Rhizobium sp. CCGE531 TaxID=2364271 RepID=UPI0013C414A4|nr:hypothetical protein [Rhizobium sp. CCGE531]
MSEVSVVIREFEIFTICTFVGRERLWVSDMKRRQQKPSLTAFKQGRPASAVGIAVFSAICRWARSIAFVAS